MLADAVETRYPQSGNINHFFLGQNGFLFAGLIGLSLALMERRPRFSGVILGLLTFLQRMDPMLGSFCSCCAADAESLQHRISSLLTSSLLSGPGFAIACRVSTRVLSSFCRRRPGDARAIRRGRVPLPHQVKGPLFHLVESPAQILADYPQKNQLEPTKEQDRDQQ
jgi:hypothetical protein